MLNILTDQAINYAVLTDQHHADGKSTTPQRPEAAATTSKARCQTEAINRDITMHFAASPCHTPGQKRPAYQALVKPRRKPRGDAVNDIRRIKQNREKTIIIQKICSRAFPPTHVYITITELTVAPRKNLGYCDTGPRRFYYRYSIVQVQ